VSRPRPNRRCASRSRGWKRGSGRISQPPTLGAGLEKQAAEHETRLAGIDQALRAEIAAVGERVGSRLDAHDIRGAGLEKQVSEHEIRLASSGNAANAVALRLAGIEQALKTHSSSIESLESAIAQTDDLVERVVEALDSLERSLAEQNDIKVSVRNN
jgi:chromosome segregation ATPase